MTNVMSWFSFCIGDSVQLRLAYHRRDLIGKGRADHSASKQRLRVHQLAVFLISLFHLLQELILSSADILHGTVKATAAAKLTPS